MKLRFMTVAMLCLGLAGGMAYAAAALKTDKDKLSYTLGNNMAANLKQQNIDINQQVFIQGFQDGYNNVKPALSPDEQKAVINNFQKNMMNKAQAQFKVDADKNAAEGKKFLADNAKKPGVKTTKSGLQYKEIETGKGPKPKATDVVTVDYEGKLLDGTVFDSSYKRGKPASFAVNQVIPGWTEGLQLMPIGSTWILYIPAKLAYGEQGAPGAIGPNQTLEFKVHLISIEKGSPQTATK